MYGRDLKTGNAPAAFPPSSSIATKPRYLDQSREHAYDGDDDILDGQLDDSDVPVLQGLLDNARHRGSIEMTRRVEDTEHGLIVGRGNATLLSSIAYAQLQLCT